MGAEDLVFRQKGGRYTGEVFTERRSPMSTGTELSIKVIQQPDQGELNQLGVGNWPIWTKEVSEFPWHYDEQETCYLLAGRVTVTTETETVTFGAGDLVVFPAGLACTWKIEEPVRKHYKFG